jgi:hypothetical protein
MDEELFYAFTLGQMAAQSAYGIAPTDPRRMDVYELLMRVARNDLTLVNSSADALLARPAKDEKDAAETNEVLQQAVRTQQEIAARIVRWMASFAK